MHETLDVASEVRSVAARRQIKHRQLAEVTGLTQPGISRRLAGTVEFTISELVAIAKLLNVPITSLIPQTTPATDSPQSVAGVSSSPDALTEGGDAA